MLYACNTCEQTFWGFDRFMPQQCPECGCMTVRKATEEEQIAYILTKSTCCSSTSTAPISCSHSGSGCANTGPAARG